jgi:uncharacterized RDD family membrane protein YckC
MSLNIKVLATSALAILAVVVLISIIGYTSTNNSALLDFAKSAFGWVIGGIIVVTLLINFPRILRVIR